MLDADYITANQIKLNKKLIARFLSKIGENKIDQVLLAEIYTLLDGGTGYDDYIDLLTTALTDKDTALDAAFAAI